MKNKTSKRIISLLLVALMMISFVPITKIEAEAASPPQTHPNIYVNTGNQINDIIGVAKTQVGYYAAPGKRTINKYYNGVHWCQAFITFCARQAGISENVIPSDITCRTVRNTMIANGATSHTNSDYKPQPGDLMFFGPNARDHVALVLWSNGSKVHIIEGNLASNGTSCVKEWDRNIWGKTPYSSVIPSEYVTPKYSNVPPPPPPTPGTPAINWINPDMAVNHNITISWSAASDAAKYTLFVTGADTKKFENITSTSMSITLDKVGKYNFHVVAYNSTNEAGSPSSPVSCTTHLPCTVTVKDYNGKEIEKIYVDYGKDVLLNAPSREGYTFQGWDGSTHGITKDITLSPIYKINTYNVKFWGADDNQLGKTQKINYGEDATPPEDTETPEGYKFVRWSSEDYKNVFTKSDDKTINIYAIYEWANENIPITCEITKAYRDSDGYHVLYDIKNNISTTQTGRAIISLKTAEGKLIYTTESKTFRLPGNSSKTNIDEFFECEETASVIEIIIVDSYKSGTPLSENVSKTVTDGLGWSNWQDGKAPEGVEAEERTVYRYRDKETTTANSKNLSGWTYASQNKSEGAWSDWSWDHITGFQTDSHVREVQSEWAYQSSNYEQRWLYYHYHNASGKSQPGWNYQYPDGHRLELNYQLSDLGYNSSVKNDNGEYPRVYGYYTCGSGGTNVWYKPYWEADTYWVEVSQNWNWRYRYKDTYYTYNFWRWKDWSGWSATEIAETSTRDVETKTQYRTFNGVEDTSGEVLTKKYYVGTEFAGKQVTLFVYKFDAASDYTDEFVGQTVIDDEGYCTFNVKLREEPSIQTGDFTFALGIEGTTSTFVVDTLEAPVPEYTVNFYDWDGNIIETQTVKEGESAVLPSYIPEKEGYDFVGWSDSLTNIRQDTDIFADMEKREYQVIFVDWENQLIEIQTFEHGDVLVTPEIAEIEGHTFEGWDKLLEGNVLVTSNMVVSAVYEVNTYTIKFCDYDGNVIDVQEVEYGKTATPPKNVESDDGKQFAGWFDSEKYTNVEKDSVIHPSYYYEETANIPTANYESGEYSENIKLTLTTEDENAVIFYYINGDTSTEKIYTGPIDITKTTAVTYYSSCINKNDSEETTQYYCINSSDIFSEWMLYNSLPEDVRVNTNDYNLENDIGYRYKNTKSTSSSGTASEYLDNGWEYQTSVYTDYTDWQDEEIVIDNSLIGFEVDTQQVPDTTITCYQYSHYKYTNSEGNVCYSPDEVEGFTCEYETVVVDNRLSIGGFLEDENGTAYYNYNDEQWFKQTKVPGEKTQYRSRYKIATYYKWSEWSLDNPTSTETRDYETDSVYRYSNKMYHIVSVITGFDNSIPRIEMFEHGTSMDLSSLNIYGYKLTGLYYDSECTDSFGLTTPVTESVTLYAKYTPETYTVTFQMQDGTEIDTQTVNYMEAAVAPATDAVPGYVFGKWDKDFDCITEDTVVTGKYYKESDYARITFNNTVLDMFQGTSVKLSYTISPANLSEETIEWTSSDPRIATVDDKGVVTSLVPGEVTITAMVTRTRETATCKVIVNEDCGNYIVLTANSTLNNDSLGYLRRIGFNTKTADAAKEFRNTNLLFYNINGTQLGADDVVGTGTVIKLMNGETLLDSETVIVTGDMTGDGLLNNRDVAMVNRYLVGKVEPQECQILALDLNGDGYINNKDAAMAARYLVGKEAII